MTSAGGKRLSGASRARPHRPRSSLAGGPRASIRKNENPSGSGAGTGLPARSQPGHGLAERGLDRVGLFGGHQEELDRGGPHRRVEGVEDEQRIGVHEIEERLDEGLAVGRARERCARRTPRGSGRRRRGRAAGSSWNASTISRTRSGMRRRPTGWRFCRSAPSRTSSCGPSWVGPRGARDLLQVVVVGQRPEDGDRRHATARELARDADRVEGLHERESRAREEADLVAGRDRDGAARGEVLGHLRGFAVPGDGTPTRERAPARPSRAARARAPPRPRASAGRGRTPEGPRGSRGREARARGTSRRGSRRASLPLVDAGLRARTIRRGESGPAGDPSKSPQVASTGSPARQKSVTSSSAAYARTLSRKISVEPSRRTSISFSMRCVSGFQERRIVYSFSPQHRRSSGTSRSRTQSRANVSQRNAPPGRSTRSISATTATFSDSRRK